MIDYYCHAPNESADRASLRMILSERRAFEESTAVVYHSAESCGNIADDTRAVVCAAAMAFKDRGHTGEYYA